MTPQNCIILPALEELEPPGICFWNNCLGSYFLATFFKFSTFAAPYPAIGFWKSAA